MSPCWAFHWLHETFICRTVCYHFLPGLMAWQHTQKRQKKKISSLPSSPKRKKPDPSS
jgi:hypothetical protein